jgi:CRP-like cAMP-binding protein
MVSPELLRRFPFFGFMNNQQFNAVALITNETTFEKGDIILEYNHVADYLYLVIEGDLALYYIFTTENDPSYFAEYYVGDINPGEIFGISALIEPYIYTGTMKASASSRVLQIEASSLRALCIVDAKLAFGFINEAAKAAMQRLNDTRVQLLSARINER